MPTQAATLGMTFSGRREANADPSQTPTSTPTASAPRVDAKQAEKANDVFWVGFRKYLKDHRAAAKNTPGGWAGYEFSTFWTSFLD